VVVKHREAIGGGGFFETQVEVIEKEEIIEIEEGADVNDSKLDTAAAKAKDDRIFGFNNFNDFR
jgi:hypothetical protein